MYFIRRILSTPRLPTGLAILIAFGLMRSCHPAPIAISSPIPSSSPIPTRSPVPVATPISVQPPALTPTLCVLMKPVLEPSGRILLKPGNTISVKALMDCADRFEWNLDGPGQISSTGPKEIIRYTAPEQCNNFAILTATAYQGRQASPRTSIEIFITPCPVSKPLDALADQRLVPFCENGSIDTQLTIDRDPENCHTGSNCLRFTVKPGKDTCGVYWRPFCIGEIAKVNCQQVSGWNQFKQFCTAFPELLPHSKSRPETCQIDILRAGNFSHVSKISFHVRGDKGNEIVTFGTGGADVVPIPGKSLEVSLTKNWMDQEIRLDGLDLAKAGILFYWRVQEFDRPNGLVFYLDDVHFEGEKSQAVTPQPLPTRQPSSQLLSGLFSRLCWIAYSPTQFDPTTNPIHWPSEADIREDFRVLLNAGFRGLVTYASNYINRVSPNQLIDIPYIAQEAGFEAMIVGIWDPTNEKEMNAASKASGYPVVIGYSVGNEGLDVRYDRGELVSAMERLREMTGKPVSTTEEGNDYYEKSPLWTDPDWIFPNIHPYFAGYSDPQEAVEWTERIFNTLDPLSQKPLVFKEVGLPSGGDEGLSASIQAEYYRLLRETNVVYVVFEAFDAPWKHLGKPNPDGTYSWPDPEPHWGIFTSDRAPKEAAQYACPVR